MTALLLLTITAIVSFVAVAYVVYMGELESQANTNEEYRKQSLRLGNNERAFFYLSERNRIRDRIYSIRSMELTGVTMLIGVSILLAVVSFVSLSDASNPTHQTLLNLPATDRDETPVQRSERLREYAYAIDAASSDSTERALLVAVGFYESRFAHDVCSGEKHGDSGRAFGCWQSWDDDRSGGVRGQARRAIDHLRRAGNYCTARGYDRLSGAVSLYATGNSCRWVGANKRVKMARGLVGVL